jgi:predicted aldo/keto reductase-like oxidoreductase
MHILVDPDEWAVAMGPGGALEAFIEARDEGLVRFLGVTGHGVTIAEMHRRSLERFDFDSVLLPYNYTMMQNPRYTADFESLLTICQERQVAVQTIKSITRGPWGNKPQNRATWYEPLEEPTAIEAAVHWVLARPGLFLDTVGDIHILPHVLAAAERFDPDMTQETAKATLRSLELTPLFV